MWKLLGLEKGKSCVIPLLSADEAEPISLFDWESNTGLYFLPIFTYALTLHGSLTYDQEQFYSKYSPVFELIDEEAFDALLKFFFPCEEFVALYKNK